MDANRAARVVDKGRLVCEQAQVRPPAEGELLVRTQMAAICGSDLHVVMMGINLDLANAPPGFPGHEGIGEVVESRHPDFAPGDRVLTAPPVGQFRCFADYQTIAAAYCVKVPKHLPLEDLLMAQQFGTVVFALRQKPVDVVGRTVMVLGQGSAGVFFSYLLKRAGAARVIATDLSEARLELGRRLGGTDVALQAGRDDLAEAVRDLTGGAGVDYLVEAVGRKETQLESVRHMREGGDILFFGLPDSNGPIPFDFDQFFRRRLTATSPHGAQLEPGLASFRHAVELIVREEINLSGMVSHRYPIENIHEAMEVADARPPVSLKVGVTF